MNCFWHFDYCRHKEIMIDASFPDSNYLTCAMGRSPRCPLRSKRWKLFSFCFKIIAAIFIEFHRKSAPNHASPLSAASWATTDGAVDMAWARTIASRFGRCAVHVDAPYIFLFGMAILLLKWHSLLLDIFAFMIISLLDYRCISWHAGFHGITLIRRACLTGFDATIIAALFSLVLLW